MDSDGDRIKALMGSRNKAEFAREFKVPGGASMVSQNISGNRPVSIEGAIAYAQGFGVPIAAISPRIDALLRAALNALDPDTPASPPPVTLDTALAVLGHHLARPMDADTRAELGEALQGWARWGGKPSYRDNVAQLLARAAQPTPAPQWSVPAPPPPDFSSQRNNDVSRTLKPKEAVPERTPPAVVRRGS